MISKRLGEYLKYKRIRIHILEDKIGASRSTLSRPIKGGKNIGSQFLEKVLIHCEDLNAKWLMTGQGEMINTYEMVNQASDPGKPYGKEEQVFLDNINHIIKNKKAYLDMPQFQILLDSLFLEERYRDMGKKK